MRTIKFRGKTVDSGEWIEGDLIHYGNTFCIAPLDGDWFAFISKSRLVNFKYKVTKETVGQFTGLTDKNGKEIYEGDVLKVSLFKKTFQVVFSESEKWGASFQYKSHNSIFYLTKYFTDTCEVIGNIHDNPELL